LSKHLEIYLKSRRKCFKHKGNLTLIRKEQHFRNTGTIIDKCLYICCTYFNHVIRYESSTLSPYLFRCDVTFNIEWWYWCRWENPHYR